MTQERREVHTVDKSTWPEGPWKSEPDEVWWTDRASGFDCRVKRTSFSGTLCGYVGVPHGHPWFEIHYDAVGADVHGGLTFSQFTEPEPEIDPDHDPWDQWPLSTEVVEELPDSRLWWLGFDCNHYGDSSPLALFGDLFGESAPNYRDIKYVTAQVEHLARQATKPGFKPYDHF